MNEPTGEMVYKDFSELLGCRPGFLLLVYREDWPHNVLWNGKREWKGKDQDIEGEGRIWKEQTTHVRFYRENHMDPAVRDPEAGPDPTSDAWTGDLVEAGLVALGELAEEFRSKAGVGAVRVKVVPYPSSADSRPEI